jgi:hypothetical protein
VIRRLALFAAIACLGWIFVSVWDRVMEGAEARTISTYRR